MRFSIRTAAVSLAVTGVIAVGGYGLASSIADEDVPEAAEEFFAAWSDGDLDKASRLTTDPPAALMAMKAYEGHMHTTDMDFTAHGIDGLHVPFTVKTHISTQGSAGNWSYESQLDIRKDARQGERIVWTPAVIHPRLADHKGYTLEAVATPPQVTVLGREGTGLNEQHQPGLSQVIDQLKERYASKAGTPALEVRITPLFGEGNSETVAQVVQGKPGAIHTTIDPALQQAAESAVATRPHASVVAIEPSTGKVLATATSSAGEMNPALEGVEAPGSVFEIVTAAALLEHKTVTPTTRVPCPIQATVAGATFTNPKVKSAVDGGTFADVFAASCDTGFVGLVDVMAPDALTQEAKDVFGLGLNWQTGVATSDGAVPELTGADRAAAAVGHGEVRLNVLNLASVTATVKSGMFKQPLFVDTEMVGADRAQAERPLSSTVAQQLRDMMRHNASEGTGAIAMADSNGTLGSMAGLAVQGTGQEAHAWFTAFNADIAVASVATSHADQGVTSSGEIARAVLDASN